MNQIRILISAVLLLALAASAAAADLKVALDARDIRSKRVHTQLTIPAKAGPLTLVYAARDEQHNEAVVLKDVLDERLNDIRGKAT